MDNSEHIKQFEKREFSANLDLALERSKQWPRKKLVMSIGSKFTIPSFSKPEDIVTYIESILAAIEHNNEAVRQIPVLLQKSLAAAKKAHDTSFKSAANLFDRIDSDKLNAHAHIVSQLAKVVGCEFQYDKPKTFDAKTVVEENEDHWSAPGLYLVEPGCVWNITIKDFGAKEIVFDKDSLRKVTECIQSAAKNYSDLVKKTQETYEEAESRFTSIADSEGHHLLSEMGESTPDKNTAYYIVENYVTTDNLKEFSRVEVATERMLDYLGKAIVHVAELVERSNSWLKSKNVG